MKKPILFGLLWLLVTAGIAQTITEATLRGKWKLSVLILDTVVIDIKNPEIFKKSIYDAGRKLKPDKIFTREDSAKVDAIIAETVRGLSLCYLNFRPRNKYSAITNLEGDREEEKGLFRVKDSLLIMSRAGKGDSDEGLIIEMPDHNTLTMILPEPHQDKKLTFKREN